MKTVLKAALAAGFAASLLGGTALAQSSQGSEPAQMSRDKGQSPTEQLDENSTGSIGHNFMSDQDIGGWSTGQVNVVAINTLDDNEPSRVFLENRIKSNPDDVAALQSAIQNNAALKAQLESQNVQINNVVAADKAADGSVTFYVR